MFDHQRGNAVAMDENDFLALLADFFDILIRSIGKFTRGDEDAFD